MKSTAAIFDLITLEGAKKMPPKLVFDQYCMLMQNQVEIRF